MTFFMRQTFPSSGQWPIYFKQDLIDQNFPTIKDLRHLKKKILTGYYQSPIYVFSQSFTVTISVLFGEI